ncbi:MAG: hypothetical protein AAFO69_01570 [Bacteroidota bacterium]
MTKYLKFIVALITIQSSILMIGCTGVGGCGDFDSRFAITDLFLRSVKADDSDFLFDSSPLVDNDTTYYDSIALFIDVETESLAHLQKGSIFSAAYACSPPPLEPTDTISSIQVFLLRKTDIGSVEVVDEVSSQFSISAYSDFSGNIRNEPLSNFNSQDQPASELYLLRLDHEPTEVIEVGYKVIFNFTNRNPLEASSRFFYITP